ncbi:MAG: phosphoenolpyruvate--protein phosphotransferase [Verrucomicrobiota bacterium]|nr:phosphoenolpyruvate--protein phosphotransferase [Verrucomicrobiota bacterium]
MPALASTGEKFFKGIPVSAGVCRGKILVLGKSEVSIPRYEISEDELPQQIERLEKALLQTRRQILEVQRQVSEGIGADHATIFDAHLLVLEDPVLIEEVTRLMQEKKVNVEFAFHQFAEKYAATLSKIDDEYLRERVCDLRDVAARILNNLLGRDGIDLRHLQEPCIIVADDLVPSQTALFDKKIVLGFVTDGGSKTSHTAIMARSLEIPAVVGLQNVRDQVRTGQYALLDGYNGQIIINPTEQTFFEYGQLERKQVNLQEKLRDLQEQSATTLDGKQITLSANIEQPGDAEAVKAYGAEGVGLFRTEYLFINREILPDEEEQYQAYRRAAVALKPHSVVIRTLDLGGDKFLSHLQIPPEMNPFLGWRAIRFCLAEKEIFRAQLRAILRASVDGNIKIMYPMISCLDELNQANALVEIYKAELRAENIPFQTEIEVGAMIEIPSAALAAGALAKRVKFFSIGTNDLIQYSLAVDRLNEKIAHLYEPTHPAILRLIKMTVEAAHKNGIRVAVCGEMAGDPVLTPLLLGLGVDELSATPSLVPKIKFLIRHLKMEDAKKLAEAALQNESGPEILARAQALAWEIAPGLFEK